LTDDFKEYWTTNTNLPYTGLFEYMIYIYKSSWYKEIKKTYGKFYFGVPVDFLEGFIIEKGS
jgi:hypothetical protein